MTNSTELYTRLGRLISSAPSFNQTRHVVTEEMLWLGRSQTAIKEALGPAAELEFQQASATLAKFMPIGGAMMAGARDAAANQLIRILYRALASAEQQVPASVQGAFISAGSTFDAFVGLGKVLQTVASDVLLIDPYMDNSVLERCALQVSEGVVVRLLSDKNSVYATLSPAITAWKAQYTTRRPIEARLAPPRTLHDRMIVVDGQVTYVVTQSFKDLAARSHAEIVRSDDEMNQLKVLAYDAMWQAADPIT